MRALIVLGGKEMPFARYAQEADAIICADSGADSALRQGITPDVLVGDMDSISEGTLSELKKRNTEIIIYPAEKDKTDGEIAVDYAKEHGASHADFVCAEGSIDHYLGNLYLLIYARKLSLSARLITEDMEVYVCDGEMTLTGAPGTRVSVVPADGEIIVLEPYGLYYPLKTPQKIAPGETIGLGNYMTGSECLIKVVKGTAFVMIQANR